MRGQTLFICNEFRGDVNLRYRNIPRNFHEKWSSLHQFYILPFNGRMLKTEVLHNETGSEEFLKTLQDDKNYEIWCIKHFMCLFSPNPNYVKH